MKKLQTFDLNCFRGKNHFGEDKSIKSDESIKSPPSHSFLNPSLNYLGAKITVRFSGNCLKQDKST